MKRRWISLGVLLLALLLIVSCGKSKKADGGQEGQIDESKKKVLVFAHQDPENHSFYEELAKNFSKDKESYRIEAVYYSEDEYFSDIMVGRYSPDIYSLRGLDIDELVSKKRLFDLGKYKADLLYDLREYEPVEKNEDFKYSYSNWAFPLGYSYPLIFYNKGIFDEFGVGVPSSVMDFGSTASYLDSLEDLDIYPFSFYLDDEGNWYVRELVDSVLTGGLGENVIYTSKSGMNPSFIELYHYNAVLRGETPPKEEAPRGKDELITEFVQNRIAIIVGNTSYIKKLDESGMDYDFFIIPGAMDYQGLALNPDPNFGIHRKSKFKDEAMEFLEYLLSPGVQEKIYKEKIALPALRALEHGLDDKFGWAYGDYSARKVLPSIDSNTTWAKKEKLSEVEKLIFFEEIDDFEKSLEKWEKILK